MKGVRLEDGLFKTAVENNIGYLLSSFTVDEMLRQFWERAGKPNPPGLRKPDKFWEEDLAGSCAGRFLMGAANTLRWVDHPELRRRVDELVDGIADCRQPNGYIRAYPEGSIFHSERAAYTRSWVTHGLIEAGYTGNPKAFELKMTTRFPFYPDVELRIAAAQPLTAKIRVRVPSWAAREMPIEINGSSAAVGKPSTYVTVDRAWSDGDTVTFRLPMEFKLTRYTGVYQIAGHERFALEYGPILMAVAGSSDARLMVRNGARPEELVKQLKPKSGQPLHFTLEGDTPHEYIPYWEVPYKAAFTCYPVVDVKKG